MTSRRSLGDAAARRGLLTTPDDHGVSAMPVASRAPGRPLPERQPQPARALG